MFLLSVLLLTGSIAFWIRSTKMADEILYQSYGPNNHWTEAYISSARSQIYFLHLRQESFGYGVSGHSGYQYHPYQADHYIFYSCEVPTFKGIRFQSGPIAVCIGLDESKGNFDGCPVQTGQRIFMIRLPHYFVTLCSGIYLAIQIRKRHRRKKRIQNGHCEKCGYDLRATPERCPECGTETAVKICA